MRQVSSVLLTIWAIASLVEPPTAQADSHEFSGYIDSTALNVRANPGTSSEVIGILLKYDPVTVMGEQKVGTTTWYSITASGGYTTGWVSAHFVKRGDPPESVGMTDVDYGKKETPTLNAGPFEYVGAKACQECHEDAVGDYPSGAYGVWKKHFHSSAFTTLGKSYTKEIAKRGRGIEDPETDWRCVKCHVTALGAAPSQLGPDYNEAEGVGCEVCHGPGGSYAQEDHGPDAANREAMGFRVLRNLDDRREVCTSCHNKASPTYKPFDLRQFSRKIAHWVDDSDNEYRAEASRESERRAKAVTATPAKTKKSAAATKATAATAAGATAAGAATAAGSKSASKAATTATKTAAKSAGAAEASASAAAEAAAASAAAKKAAAADKASKAAAAAEKAEQRARAEAQEVERKRVAEEKRAAAAAAKAKADAESRAKAAPPPPKKPKAAPAKASNNPLAHFLDDVDDVIVMNKKGRKYEKLRFQHRKHAGGEYLPDGDCQTCHHTQEGTDAPEACSDCHNIGGDAEEEKSKKRYAHSKKKTYPKAEDQEEVSCAGCHKSMNAMLDSGERQGDEAPTKCTTCHERKS